jgi:hypothetical protein
MPSLAPLGAAEGFSIPVYADWREDGTQAMKECRICVSLFRCRNCGTVIGQRSERGANGTG